MSIRRPRPLPRLVHREKIGRLNFAGTGRDVLEDRLRESEKRDREKAPRHFEVVSLREK